MDKLIIKLKKAWAYTMQAMMVYVVGKTALSLLTLVLVPASIFVLENYSRSGLG